MADKSPDILSMADRLSILGLQIKINVTIAKELEFGMGSRPLSALRTARESLEEAIKLMDQAGSNLLVCAGKLRVPDARGGE